MEKVQISATVIKETANAVQEMADKQGRSFSWMVNYLLTQVVLAEKMKKG